MTKRILAKLVLAIASVLVIALVAMDFLTTRLAEASYVQTLNRELDEKCRMLDLLPEQQLITDIRQLAHAAGGRITIIDLNGRVLADSEAVSEKMENHKNRREFISSLGGIRGSDVRTSATLGIQFLYVAIPYGRGALRLAVPMREIEAQVAGIRRQVLLSALIAFFPALLIAIFIARYYSRRLAVVLEFAGRLARGDFGSRLRETPADEIGTLSAKLNETGEKLQGMFTELQREQVALKKLEQVRKDFVINVSHELRTPLASIQGYTETLLDGALEDPNCNVKFLGIIRQNAERLGRLIGDILTLSRIELRTQKLQFGVHPVAALLDDNFDSMRPMLEKKGIEIQIEAPAAGTDVYCDPEAVHQILSNLMDNAIKYTPEKGSIRLGAQPLRQDAGFVEFYVQDTGAGIPADDLPRLFERFYRVDKARSRELGGTGLGLAIVKHLVKAHGGDVRVDSELHAGSTFWFTLPVARKAGNSEPEGTPIPSGVSVIEM
ncbi:MAG TPA: ATP-binding protein [Bryobacteraceae bacterium]|nr:ATP-binding protein [Bryobacteraceae bacterium]